jgi:P-type conjugative transfer protein TrbG
LAEGDLMIGALKATKLQKLDWLWLSGLLAIGLCLWMAGARLAVAADRFNDLEDAAASQAREWQKGGRAKPIMSSDGKVVFAYGQSMPKLTCSPTRACDVEMQPGEKVKKVVLGDSVNWAWSGADSVEHGVTVQHVIFQPRDSDLESNVIILTDHRSYHIKLYAPKTGGAYINRAGFYYPQELVQGWEDTEAAATSVADKVDEEKVMSSSVSIDKMDFNYTVSGSGSFKPVHVFNDGERTYMEMPDNLRVDGSPIMLLLDEKGDVMKVNYRREEDPKTGVIHYVVDKLFSQAELRLGEEKVKIVWKRKGKGLWG